MKLLLDEMWTAAIAVQLRRRGHDVEAVVEREDLVGRPDPTIFAVAQAEQRVIVSENVPHFRHLAEARILTGQRHCGLVFTTNHSFPRSERRTPGRMVAALSDLLQSDPDLQNLEHWLAQP